MVGRGGPGAAARRGRGGSEGTKGPAPRGTRGSPEGRHTRDSRSRTHRLHGAHGPRRSPRCRRPARRYHRDPGRRRHVTTPPGSHRAGRLQLPCAVQRPLAAGGWGRDAACAPVPAVGLPRNGNGTALRKRWFLEVYRHFSRNGFPRGAPRVKLARQCPPRADRVPWQVGAGAREEGTACPVPLLAASGRAPAAAFSAAAGQPCRAPGGPGPSPAPLEL